jgi:hypothetical protein
MTFLAILQAIAAIPKLIGKIEELLGLLKKADEEKWFQKSAEVFDNIKPGTTSEQKSESAKEIQNLISGI